MIQCFFSFVNSFFKKIKRHRALLVCWQSQQTVRIQQILARQGAELAKKGF
jgi:hypothetical protein